MAWAYESCNHVIITLYKLEYANNKGWVSPACTDIVCQWNESTKKMLSPVKYQTYL